MSTDNLDLIISSRISQPRSNPVDGQYDDFVQRFGGQERRTGAWRDWCHSCFGRGKRKNGIPRFGAGHDHGERRAERRNSCCICRFVGRAVIFEYVLWFHLMAPV